MRIPEKKKEKETKEIIEAIRTEIFQKVMLDTKPHTPVSSENTN